METLRMGVPSAICQPFEIVPVGIIFEGSDVADTKLLSSDEKLLQALNKIMDSQLLTVLESRTATEFIQSRERVLPKYFRSLRALSDTISNLFSQDQIAIITELGSEVFKEDLEKQRGVRFGDVLVDQVIFTLWVMRKTASLGRKIHEAGEPSDKDADLRLYASFQAYLLWTTFHMYCVMAATKFRKSVPADVQDVMCEGLRSAVNVYAIMKQALRLRRPELQKSFDASLPWDEEDEELLASSMRDIDAISDLSDH